MIETLKRDETGIALPVAMMMVVLISVMGAGLLVFATTDLTTAAEVNRGQQAFEMADAGIQAASIQLENQRNAAVYNSTFEWSRPAGKDLSMDGNAVNVRIAPNSPSPDLFTVTSTGTAGDARRKVEAIFKIPAAPGTNPVASLRSWRECYDDDCGSP